MKRYWDHSTKPSTWVIKEGEEEVFRGNYRNGVMYLKSLENDGMISFENDYLPAMKEVTKITYRLLRCEQETRREIIKLRKEIKGL